MKLSEAIRLGAMLKPQGVDGYFFHDGATCALGAAADAVGMNLQELMDDGSFNHLRAEWPWLDKTVQHPAGNYKNIALNIILDLNDSYEWTREQIADWVATIEPPETPPATERTSDAESAVLVRPSEEVKVYAR